MPMKPATVETWIWVLVYGGLLLGSLGLFSRASDPALSLGLIVGGGALVALGVVLVAVRARMPP